MQLQYDMSEDDYRLAQEFFVKQVRRGNTRRALAVNLLIWVVIGVLVAFFSDHASPGMRDALSSGVIYFCAAALVVGGALILYSRTLRKRQRAALAPYPIPHTVELHDQGMSMKNRFAGVEYAWAAFTGAQQLASHVGIVFRANSVMVIPNAAFASSEARHAFIAAIEGAIAHRAA